MGRFLSVKEVEELIIATLNDKAQEQWEKSDIVSRFTKEISRYDQEGKSLDKALEEAAGK